MRVNAIKVNSEKFLNESYSVYLMRIYGDVYYVHTQKMTYFCKQFALRGSGFL